MASKFWKEVKYNGMTVINPEMVDKARADDKAEKFAKFMLVFMVASAIGYAVMSSFVVGLITGNSLAIGFVVLIGIAAVIVEFILVNVSFITGCIMSVIGSLLLIARIVIFYVLNK